MKKLMMLMAGVTLAFGQTNAQYQSDYVPSNVVKTWVWNGFEHVVFQSDGHLYLEVRNRQSGFVTVIHYESCPCKARR